VRKLEVDGTSLVWEQAPRPSGRRHNFSSSAQFAEKFLLVHPVLKSLSSVDENHGNFIVIQASDFGIGVHVDFTPAKTAPLVQFDDALLDDFAEMASLAGINHDFAKLRHARECSSFGAVFPRHGRP
jgi:hypothetical protein